MDLVLIAVLLLIGGAILLAAEVVLPTAGIVGIMGVLCILGAVGTCFAINPWFGLALFLAVLAASPFLARLMGHWYRTKMWRVAVANDAPPPSLSVRVGQNGIAISELRPMGVVSFDDQRVEAISQAGMIKAGTAVVAVEVGGNRVTVRRV